MCRDQPQARGRQRSDNDQRAHPPDGGRHCGGDDDGDVVAPAAEQLDAQLDRVGRAVFPLGGRAQVQALAAYDEPTRKKAYSTIQKLLARDVPEDFIWYPRQAQPINPAFKGFAPNPINEAWNAHEWEM